MAGETDPTVPFIGRVTTAESLRRTFAEVRAGSSAVTLLLGDAGVGKSVLVDELVREVRTGGAHALVGRPAPGVEPAPFSVLRNALESASNDLDPDGAAAVGEPMLIAFVPGLGRTEYPTPTGIEGRLLEALGSRDAREVRTRDEALAALTERFLALTRRGPTVVVIEDLSRTDPTTVAAVEFFAKELENQPLWILATSRPAHSLAESGRARLEKFRESTRATTIELPPFTEEETADYLRRSDPTRDLPPAELLRRFSETRGSPQLLARLDQQSPKRDDDSEGRSDRDSPLSEGQGALLDLAAVLGPQIPFPVLHRASGGDEERVAEEVDALVDRGWLFERPGELLEFAEDRLREDRYAGLPERLRRALHRRAGEALEAWKPGDPSGTFSLARHFYLAHDASRSVRYNRIAAEIAERSLAPDVAWECLSHALESQSELRPPDLDQEAELVLGLARLLEELGVLAEAERVLEEFLGRETPGAVLTAGRRASLEMFLARVLMSEGKLPRATALAERVLADRELDGQELVRLAAHHELGLSGYYGGRYSDALEHHTAEAELARQLGDPLVLLRARLWRAADLAMLGSVTDAVAEARAITVERDRLGLARESAQAHLFLGDILADARTPPEDRADAIGEYARAIEFAEAAKDPRRMGWALYKTAELLREAGRLTDATERVERACHILGQVGDQVGLGVSLKARAQIALDRNEFDAAERDLLEARRLLRDARHEIEEVEVVLRLAQLARERGRSEDAAAYVHELHELRIRDRRPDLAEEFDTLLGVHAGGDTERSGRGG